MSNQRVSLLGRLAVHNKMISMDQLTESTEEQGRRNGQSNLGEILVEKGFITTEQLAKLLDAQKQMVVRQRASQAASAAAPDLETKSPKSNAAADSRSEPMTPPPVETPTAAPAAPAVPAAPAASASSVAPAAAPTLEPEPKRAAPDATSRPADPAPAPPA
ncbi:MAG: hypothetical protein JRD03_07820, partial [Deltaproteobacteria bacterium]|nr:hypothetical protein [Deltaproteobacteria bacterium]